MIIGKLDCGISVAVRLKVKNYGEISETSIVISKSEYLTSTLVGTSKLICGIIVSCRIRTFNESHESPIGYMLNWTMRIFGDWGIR